jgi:ABC-type sugar transport system ATPase subunit
MSSFLSVTYAATVAFSQAIATFAQIRADQHAIAKMTDKQIQQLSGGTSQKTAIGFQENIARN